MPKKHKLPLNPEGGLAIFTDGSSDSRDRSGGWAWIAMDVHGTEISASGGVSDTTNNRMEMTAWIEALNKLFNLFGECQILVYSDSEYVGLGAMDRERNRNKNQDLWKVLDEAIDQHLYIEFIHIKGHNGDLMNSKADYLAGEARKRYRNENQVKEC